VEPINCRGFNRANLSYRLRNKIQRDYLSNTYLLVGITPSRGSIRFPSQSASCLDAPSIRVDELNTARTSFKIIISRFRLMPPRPPSDDSDEQSSDDELTDWPPTDSGQPDSNPPWILLGVGGLVAVAMGGGSSGRGSTDSSTRCTRRRYCCLVSLPAASPRGSPHGRAVALRSSSTRSPAVTTRLPHSVSGWLYS